MKIIYYVMDLKTGKSRFESSSLAECEKYVVENCCTFSTTIRKKTVYK